MPVRTKAVNFLLDRFIGVQWFSYGEIQSMPEKDYEAVVEYANEIYDRLINYIDWERVMLEATGRCSALDHDHERHDPESVCAESVKIALRVGDRPWYGDNKDWQEAEAALQPIVYDPRGWSIPKELSSMFSAYVRARRKSITNQEEN